MQAREGMVGFRIAPDWPRPPPLELAAALEIPRSEVRGYITARVTDAEKAG